MGQRPEDKTGPAGPGDENEARRGLPADAMPRDPVAKGWTGEATAPRTGATAGFLTAMRAPTVASMASPAANAARSG